MREEEIKALIREVLAETFAPLLGIPQEEPAERWVDLADAWHPLGYPSYQALYKAVRSGVFREGVEVCDRRLPGAKTAQWQIDLIAARKRLKQNPRNRRSV